MGAIDVRTATAGAISSGIDWSAADYRALRRAHEWVIPERLNIAEIACDRHADGTGRLAILDDEDGSVKRCTFDELADLTDRFAGALRQLGVEQGDRVAVFLPQRLENAIAHLATFKLGAISVPLSPLFRADALEYRLGHSGARVLVTDAEHVAHVAAIRDRLPNLASVICCEERAGADWLWAMVRAATPIPRLADTTADDPAMIIYTSGTTGMPKGVLHAHRFVPGRLDAFELTHRLESEHLGERPFWTPADWSWVAGLVDCLLTPLVFACPVLAHRRRFDPQTALELVARHNVRSLFLPPTALNRLRMLGDEARAHELSVFSVHSAGEPLTAETYEWASSLFGCVFDLYGMTEICALVGSSPYTPVRPGAIGRPNPGHEVVILGDDGQPIRGVGEGEIAVGRDDPGMFLEYWDDPDATAARFRGDYMLTGDLARRDEDGYFWYQGRLDDVFNTSGYRVGPTEIERALAKHPAVAQAAVVGAPDRERGAIVKAFVVLAPGFDPGAALAREIQEFVRAGLALYQYPRKIVFARELPVTVSSKVRRCELRAEDADDRFGLLVAE